MQRTTRPSIGSPSNDPALLGAALAFRATPSPSNKNVSVPPSTYGGALAAASRAGGTGLAVTWKPLVPVKKVDRVDSNDASLTASRDALKRSNSQMDGIASSPTTKIHREASPSYIAATRAASRSRPPAIHTGILNEPSYRNKATSQASVTTVEVAGLDETHIPPTNRLVELFEAKQRSEMTPPPAAKKVLEIPEHSNIISPIPIRPSLSIRIKAPAVATEAVPDPVKSADAPKTSSKSLEYLDKENLISNDTHLATKASDVSSKPSVRAKVPPKLPAPRKLARSKTMSDQSTIKLASTTSKPSPNPSVSPPTRKQAQSQNQSKKQPPILPPPRRTRPASIGPQLESHASLTRTASTPPVLPRRFTQLPPGGLKPQLTADSLANAMVASSLASSRAPSPTHSHRPESIYRQPAKSHSIASFLLLHSPTYSPSPPKYPPAKPPGLRQTLRPSPSSSDDEDNTKRRNHQHKHGFLIKKHPNKHAEGARRHWRDSITESERKRYEGVWAANRGVLINHELAIDPTTEQDEVHGFVVRDIFSRSGLGDHVLSEIWELVEGGGRTYRVRQATDRSRSTSIERRGRLKRHEFVVGLWLVDQCLKGRKLPFEVGESVWDSAKGLMSGLRAR